MKMSEHDDPMIKGVNFDCKYNPQLPKNYFLWDSINQKRIQILIGEEFSTYKLDNLKKCLQSKEGTVFNQILHENKLAVTCSGNQSVLLQKDKNNPFAQFLKKERFCNFQLNFSSEESKQSNDPFQELVLISQVEKKENSSRNKFFKLIQSSYSHSEKCVTLTQNFVYARNHNFIKSNSNLIQKLVSERYLEINKPEKPKVKIHLKQIYHEYICQYFGYDFVIYGYEHFNSSKSKTSKAMLKKIFDNEIQKARKTYGISSLNPKYSKEKPKKRFTNKKIKENEDENEKQQSPYETSIRKKNQNYVKNRYNFRKRQKKNQ